MYRYTGHLACNLMVFSTLHTRMDASTRMSILFGIVPILKLMERCFFLFFVFLLGFLEKWNLKDLMPPLPFQSPFELLPRVRDSFFLFDRLERVCAETNTKIQRIQVPRKTLWQHARKTEERVLNKSQDSKSHTCSRPTGTTSKKHPYATSPSIRDSTTERIPSQRGTCSFAAFSAPPHGRTCQMTVCFRAFARSLACQQPPLCPPGTARARRTSMPESIASLLPPNTE